MGVRTIATRNDDESAIVTVRGSALMKSPMAPVSITSGRKAAMMVNVAVSTGITSFCGALPGSRPPVMTLIEELYVIIGNDYCIVDNQAQDSNHRRQRYLVQLYT